MTALERIELVLGDITEMDVDAVGNAANNDLGRGAGVAGASRRKGGPSIQEECNRIGTVPVGEAAVTTGGRLKARHVIHAASMRLGGATTEESLRASTRNSLVRAKEKGLRTIAFPAVGTGVAGYPLKECARVMIEEVVAHLRRDTSLEKVCFVLYDAHAYEVFKAYYDSLEK